MALHENKMAGHAQVYKPPHLRRRGTGDLVIYLHQDFHNVGLGTAMLNELIALARSADLHRIGLSVVADNEPAVRIYQKWASERRVS